jgi:hypothetical protein
MSRRFSGPQQALSLRLDADLPGKAADHIRRAVEILPLLVGAPINIYVLPELTASRGKLLTGHPKKGTPVHAASFIRERRIVLESALLRAPESLRLILIHELFHFVWARLGSRIRMEYEALLQNELRVAARGELGESSSVKKESLEGDVRHWREYVCESFCDTAAWLHAGVRQCQDYTLRSRFRKRRATWFEAALDAPLRC